MGKNNNCYSQSPEYHAWEAMIARCYNDKYRNYKDYGGRGIQVCDRWRYSSRNFMNDMGSRPPKHSLDRINVDGDYEPSNCRWADSRTQQLNKRNKKLFTFRGETINLVCVSEKYGISLQTLFTWIRRYGTFVDRLEKRLNEIETMGRTI